MNTKNVSHFLNYILTFHLMTSLFLWHFQINISCRLPFSREQGRLPSETRSKDYLKKEFKERLARGPVKYKLQLTLHEPRPDDLPEILNIARYWNEASHPWLDLADVTLATLLAPDVTEQFRFNAGNLSSCLAFLPPRSIYHSNCIAHIRKEVYARTQKIRSLRGSRQVADDLTTYFISVETGSQSRAGTDASISLSLTGKLVT